MKSVKPKVPNKKTRKAMKEADRRIGKTISYEEFIKESKANISS